MAKWTMLFLLLFNIKNVLCYSAPEDCEWTTINEVDISLTCYLERIVASGILATNFSLIQSDSTSTLTIICDSSFFESFLAPKSFFNLQYLKELNIHQCKLKNIDENSFAGLNNLRNISIQTENNFWKYFSLNISDDSFNNLHQLVMLDLSHNYLKTFSSKAICHLSTLKILKISYNHLTSLHFDNSTLDNNGSLLCASSLTELDASHNQINSVNQKNIQKFKELRIINLAFNSIDKIEAHLFENFEFLQVINFSNNNLTDIPTLLFQDSPDLREIYFQNNLIYELSYGLFNGLQQLLILNLSSNYISNNFLAEPFIDLIRLIVLDLSDNELTFINNTLFLTQNSLQMLYLSHNKIRFIEDNSFISLHNLHTIDLSNNHLEYLDIFTLNGLYVLSRLSLSYNNIYSIHPDSFLNCSAIEDLSLQGNNLSLIPDALSSLHFLKNLDLKNNLIKSLHNSSLVVLKQLRYINLSQNIIGNLTSKVLNQMTSLLEIDLSQNQIYYLEHGLFDGAESLEKIILNDNYLTDINGLFMSLKLLRHINVSRNNIQWFDYAVIPMQLEELDLHSNEIGSIGNYYELESTLQLKQIDMSYNNLGSVSSVSFPNRIKIIKLNNNKIDSVNPSTFTAKTNLTFVDLSNNNIQNLEINTFRLNRNVLRSALPYFAISGNPFFCDCNMEWLHHINKQDGSIYFPHIIDFDKVICKLSFSRPYSSILLSKSKSSDFLCKYGSHCFALCHCCEFDACDCEMVCPDECTCFSDQTWNTNIVDCNSQNYSSIPSVIPMDVTDLYLDGNNISHLSSLSFIGRKNMRLLFLNNSNIHAIKNRTFDGLSNLRILHIENNQLTALYGHEFENLVLLEELYLSSNKISFIANITFKNLKMLTILNLNNNFITEFEVWTLSWNSRLKSVQLGQNPWICDCDYLELFHEWLVNAYFVKDLSSLQCKYNETAGLFLTAFNISSCFQSSYTTYFEFTLYTYYIIIPIISLLLFTLLLIFLCRYDVKVWLYTKYGIRLFKRSNFSAEREKLFDAFVSYSKRDESFVLQILAPELEYGAPSYRLCLRYRDLPLSEYIAEAVSEAIDCSKRILIVLTEHFLQSDSCRYELTSAYHESQCNLHQKLIIVALGKISLKTVDEEIQQCLGNAHIVYWDDKRFWYKLRYFMPSVDPKMLIR